ncbi:MAG: hypothetical protein M9941_14280 [Anaerolineae bacterium]|nr:hypothetical protein [Anaerolineae bacterium]MCO5194098.1 hypothetical protein [Anaerolineae bacterium]MCO5198908.1 hypothetical protein [Anaerolineae bacterium]
MATKATCRHPFFDPEFLVNKPEQNQPNFANSAEAEFANLLDYYGIEWQYEPRTFDLEWDADGNVTQAFSPDFYLPGQDLYIELTTLRPKLAGFKNRKIRRMQELYPDINVKLFKRGDIRRLMTKYGIDDEAARIQGTEAQPDADET